MKKLLNTPLWKIFTGPKYANGSYLPGILIPNFLSGLLEGASFAFILLGFSCLQGGESFSLDAYPIFSHFSFFKNQKPNELFLLFILFAVALQAFRSAVSYIGLYVTSLLALKIQTEMQIQIYKQIFRFSFPFVSNFKSGDLIEYAKAPTVFIPVMFDALNRFIISALMICSATLFMFWISPFLTVITLMLFTLFAWVQKYLIAKVSQISKQFTQTIVEFSHQTVQCVQGVRPIHIFNRFRFVHARVSELLDKIASISKKLHLWNNSIPTISETINVLLVGAILIVGSLVLSQDGGSVLPSLLTYIALTYRLATRLQIALGSLGAVAIHFGHITRSNEILEEKGKEFLPEGGLSFPGLKERIEFKDVSLIYPSAKNAAIEKLTFTIRKGSTVALVGLSGAGKSTVLDLLLNLYRPNTGEILVDSCNLNEFSCESWRACLGVVSQDSFLFNESIEQNIRFGDLNASFEQIIEASKAAGAHEFISKLPASYSTPMGERGYRLSGGERQRIVLARALLKNPEILILDEATSNLDSHSEQCIQKSIEQLQGNKTILIVAHRLSAVTHADQIFVLDQGKLIESGDHETLLNAKGRYCYFWQLQFRDVSSMGAEL